ncbi:hypothetical protein [Halopseudomonas aestusnigri]|uniref:Uncharacterized protein n=1 Tax=Halopseudomonas aestusnigri TaxID=857252 RepID=A0AAQ1JRL2_9GAMM|nr:hypothetical protein [Halopseudomonas aestusnigri]OWL84035.1 hypothetical protein B7O88_16855 [Halopseudomonas aestusnigri]SEG72177.1 hypothetical protein SAMN05216586_1187 [Halopseudomonas aestusnigri]
MKPASFILDRRLYELLQQSGYTQFTTRDLRDAYAERLEEGTYKLGDVRLFVYEQIRRMIRVGWLVPDEQQRKRGQIYHLQPFPKRLKLELVDRAFERSGRDSTKTEQVPLKSEAATASTSTSLQGTEQHVRTLLKEVRLDFLAAMGEAERYKQLLDEMPQLRGSVEEDYLEARDRGSRLLGHLRAVEKTLKALEASQ